MDLLAFRGSLLLVLHLRWLFSIHFLAAVLMVISSSWCFGGNKNIMFCFRTHCVCRMTWITILLILRGILFDILFHSECSSRKTAGRSMIKVFITCSNTQT